MFKKKNIKIQRSRTPFDDASRGDCIISTGNQYAHLQMHKSNDGLHFSCYKLDYKAQSLIF